MNGQAGSTNPPSPIWHSSPTFEPVFFPWKIWKKKKISNNLTSIFITLWLSTTPELCISCVKQIRFKPKGLFWLQWKFFTNSLPYPDQKSHPKCWLPPTDSPWNISRKSLPISYTYQCWNLCDNHKSSSVFNKFLLFLKPGSCRVCVCDALRVYVRVESDVKLQVTQRSRHLGWSGDNFSMAVILGTNTKWWVTKSC